MLRSTFAMLLLCLALAFGTSSGQDVPPPPGQGVPTQVSGAARPLEELLRPDGTLDTESGYRGGVSVDGWRMEGGPDGGPRFVRDELTRAEEPSEGILPPLTLSSPDDVLWDSRFQRPGVNGWVEALAIMDGAVYVGGVFTTAGGVTVNSVAKWDGALWTALGSGITDATGCGDVNALALDGAGNLYAGGSFTAAGGVAVRNVAKWDGAAWSGLGTGVNGTVRALAFAGGTLYAGGSFTEAGGISASNVAAWTGAAWSPLGSGVDAGVMSLVVDAGVLYAAGWFTTAGGVAALHVASWNGAAWSGLGAGLAGEAVHALAVHAGSLYAGGRFHDATVGYHIARWNGSTWSALGSGMTTYGYVYALAVDGSGNVYAGGSFTTAGGVSASRVARWNGSAWSALGAGVGEGPGSLASLRVSALAADAAGKLYAGGSFDIAGDYPVQTNDIARWDGAEWWPLGDGLSVGYPEGKVKAAVIDAAGDLVVGIEGGANGALHHILSWDGTRWSTLGSGVDGDVHALALDWDGLYAGGSFTTAGGVPASNVARWNGAAWAALGTGVNGVVRALACDGNVYVGGEFTYAGGVSANYVAFWNSGEWYALGSGMNNHVNSLSLDGSYLYAGGEFTYAGGTSANHIARWDLSTWPSSWSALAGGLPVDVVALACPPYHRLPYLLYAGYDGGDYGVVRAWDGSQWTTLGLFGPPWTEGPTDIRALAVDLAGNLYVGGLFGTPGGDDESRIARWNGVAWSSLGSGMGPATSAVAVQALAADGQGQLYAGGSFAAAGGKPSSCIALWHAPPWPRITVSHAGQGSISPDFTPGYGSNVVLVPLGGNQTFTITPASGYHIEDVLVNGFSEGAVPEYTFIDVESDQSIHAVFAAGPYTITASTSGPGTISPSGAVIVAHGDDQTFTIAPTGGASIEDVLVDNVSVGPVPSHTFWDVTANHTIKAKFTPPQAFTEMPTALAGVAASATDWGDYDNDRDLDVLLAGDTLASGYLSRVYRNDGGGTFVDIGAGLPGTRYGSVDWGDYDSDGDLDILLAGETSTGRVAAVFRNDGAAGFVDAGAALPGIKDGCAVWGDCDSDGDLDVLLTGKTGSALLADVYRNDGSGPFVALGTGMPGVTFSDAAWGDCDNDGDLDILLTGTNYEPNPSAGALSRIYRNDGGTYVDMAAGLTQTCYASVAWGDYDNEGDLDILIVGNGGFLLYRNDGGSGFHSIPTGFPSEPYVRVAWGDYDNDGDLDVLKNSYAAASQVYRNDAGVLVANVNAELDFALQGSCSWGDQDDDGDLDILLTGVSLPDMVPRSHLYRNECAVTNTPPAPPAGLAAERIGNSVRLTWTEAADGQTPAAGLNYNVRIGTASGGGQILSGMADLASGRRRVVQLGNAQARKSWTLPWPSTASLFWSVQAEDAAYAGSPFAAENILLGIDWAGLEAPASLSAPERLPSAEIFGRVLVNTPGILEGPPPTLVAELGYGPDGSNPAVDPAGWQWSAAAFHADVGAYDEFVATLTVPAAGQYDYCYRYTSSGAPWVYADLDGSANGYSPAQAGSLAILGIGWANLQAPDSLSAPVGQACAPIYGRARIEGHTSLPGPLTGLTAQVGYGPAGTDPRTDGRWQWGEAAFSADVDGCDEFAGIHTVGTKGLYDCCYRYSLGGGAWVYGDLDGAANGYSPDQAGILRILAIDWTSLQWPTSLDLLAGAAGGPVYGQVQVAGLTEQPGASPQLVGEIGWGPDGSVPEQNPEAWHWSAAAFSADVGANDMFEGTITPTAGGVYDYCYRYSYAEGAWFYGDLDGSANGYSPLQAGALTVVGIGWAGLQGPPAFTMGVGDTSASIYGRVLIAGVTSQPGAAPGLAAELGFGPDGSDPVADPGAWQWVEAAFSGDVEDKDEFAAALTLQETGLYAYCYRYALNGTAWVYGDLDGSANGYSPLQAGSLAVVQPDFRDVTGGVLADAGIGQGVAWGDYDGDGHQDLYLSNAGQANRLFHNEGDGTFVDATTGPLGDTANNAGVAWGDYDNDGDLDLLLANWDGTGIDILRNDGGGAFSDVMDEVFWAGCTGVAWGDYDNDGDLDFYSALENQLNRLFRNDGGDQFTNVASGPIADPEYGLGVAWGDYDSDGDLDLFLAKNWTGTSKLFRNDGGGSFVDATSGPLAGVDGMSPAWGDYDNDGDLDLYLGRWGAPSKLFRNEGGGAFADVAGGPLAAAWTRQVTWADYDNDGDLDLCRTTWWGRPVELYRNEGGDSFADATGYPLPGEGDGLGAAWADYDNDGDLDLYVALYEQANKLYRNQVGSANHWLQVKLEGAQSNRAGIGAKVVVVAGGIRQLREVSGGAGYFSQDSLVQHFGLGAGAIIDSLIVRWPSGVRQVVLPAPAVDALVTVTEPPPAFTDVTASSGPVGDAGAGHGVAWGDYDDDGYQDLYLANSGQANKLFHNQGDGTFADATSGGLGDTSDGGAAVWGDYDNNGTLDLYLVNYSGQADRLFRNEGSGVFADATSGPLLNIGGGRSATWGDCDNDGDLDLYVSHEGQPNRLFRNDGSGVFADATSGPLGVDANTYGVAWGDYDNDADLDLYLAVSGQPCKLFRNDGGMTFVDATGEVLGITEGVGPAWGDYDNDRDLDLFVSRWGQPARLFRNEGPPSYGFTDATSGPLGDTAYGQAVSWGDYDNDGDLDLCWARWEGQAIRLCRNDGGGAFVDVTSGALRVADRGCGVAWADYDRDGDLDLYFSRFAQANKLFRNEVGSSNHWLQVKLVGTQSNRSGIGARVIVVGGGRRQIRDVSGGSGLWSQNSLVQQFGLGSATAVDSLIVRWPSGVRQVVDPPPSVDALTTVQEYRTVFTPVPCGLPNFSSSSVAWGDYLNDGYLDLLVTGEPLSISRVYANVGGTGSFTDIGAGLVGVTMGDATWGDYDRDGDLDIALTGYWTAGYQEVSRIYRNDAGAFTDIAAGLLRVSNGRVAWGDYDNDGDLDLLLAGYYPTAATYVARLYRNDGGAFATPSPSPGLIGVSSGQIAWGDYDGDGNLDLLLTGANGSNWLTRVYRNGGAGTFTDIGAGLPGLRYGRADWGDYDADGDLDLLLAGYDAAGATEIARVYRNDAGAFADVAAGLLGVSRGTAAWGDYDNDGDLDVLLSGERGTTTPVSVTNLYRNDEGAFSCLPEGLMDKRRGGAAWGDYDNDGDLDLLLTGLTGTESSTVLYRNDGPQPNAPPAAPQDLYHDLAGWPARDRVTLNWTAPADDRTPVAGLSYNLRVGTTPGGCEVFSAMADATGWRRVAARGTVQGLSWTLKLSPGIEVYYWSVQAVDGTLAGGSFSPEQRFYPALTAVPEPVVPDRFALLPNAPNPFNPSTTIAFDLPLAGPVRLAIYDVKGRRVRLLVDGEFPPGRHRATWDGTADGGHALASGLYFCRMESGDFRQTRRLTLLK